MLEFDAYEEYEPPGTMSRQDLDSMAAFLETEGICFHTCNRPEGEQTEREYIEQRCLELENGLKQRLHRPVTVSGMPTDWKKRTRHYFEGRFMTSHQPRIYMQDIRDICAKLYLDRHAVLSVDLSSLPHTREGQRPNIDWSADEIIDLHIASLREKVRSTSRREEIIVTPRLQSGYSSTIDFDIRYAT